MAEEPDGRVHSFQPGVGEAEGDGVRDLVAVGVEGDGDADERVEFAEARGEDPFVEQSHRFSVIVGPVDGA